MAYSINPETSRSGSTCMKSNHPPRIIENIPKSISKRLFEISIGDDHSFNEAAPLYQKAAQDDSGHNHRLTFTPSITQSSNSTRRYRHRNIIWYNLPFSKNVATNVGPERSLKSITKSFRKIMCFTISLTATQSKSATVICSTSVKQKIDGNNKSTLQKTTTSQILKACNCMRPADCHMAGNCLKSAVVYQATVTTEDNRPVQTYVGLTENSFLKLDLPIANLLLTTPTRESVQRPASMFGS